MNVFKKKEIKRSQFTKLQKKDLKKIKGGGDSKVTIEELELVTESWSIEIA